jgi:hypothetical protein
MDVRQSECQGQEVVQPASPQAVHGADASGPDGQLSQQQQDGHAAAMEEAFLKSQAAIHSQWDL